MNKRYWSLVIIALVIFCVDQLTKIAIKDTLQEGQIVTVIPTIFNITLTFNKGSAFGLFANLSDGIRQLVLGVATVAALSTVLYLIRHRSYQTRVPQVALGLILGGALGNIIDRIRFGSVVDFLDFYLGEHHWPAFNIADSAICCGVVLLLFYKPKGVGGLT